MTVDDTKVQGADLLDPEEAGVDRQAPARRLVSQLWWVRLGRSVSLVAIDLLVLAGLGMLSALVWAVGVRNQPFGIYAELLPLAGLFLFNFGLAGLYPGFGLGAVETIRRLWIRASFVFVVLAAVSFALRLPHHFSRLVFVSTWVGSLLLLPLARFLFLSLVQRSRWWGEPAVVVGEGWVARRTIRSLENALSFGYKPLCVLVPEEKGKIPNRVAGLPVLGGLEHAEDLAVSRGYRVALVAVEDVEESTRLVHHLQQYYHHVLSIRGSPDMPVEGAEVRNLGGVLAVEFRNQLLRRRNRVIKRVLDVLLGGLGLLAAAPLIVVSVLAVKLADRGPGFYSQEREGLGGEKIQVWKLRTMYTDAERRLEEHLESDSSARREWERCFKLKRDPRILPGVGAFLRRCSIDELPQLWNVVKGEMSLVGPRPFPDYHLLAFSPEFRRLRCKVRPGLTGLWQVMVRSSGSVEQQEFYDTYYIRNWSVWMDLYILAKTSTAVLMGRGAH